MTPRGEKETRLSHEKRGVKCNASGWDTGGRSRGVLKMGDECTREGKGTR